MRRPLAPLSAAALILALLTLIVTPARAQGDPFPRTVVDDTGQAVTVPARPTTVVTVGETPALAQIVEAEALRPLPVPPPDALAWEGVGLLVIPHLHAIAYPALVKSAQDAGVSVFTTALLPSLEAYRAHITALGRATGRDERAAAALGRLDRRIAALQTRLKGVGPVRVLVLTPERYTFGQGTLISDLIAAAGGVNVAAGAGYGDIRQLTDADIRALAPQVILLTPAWAQQTEVALPALKGARLLPLPFGPTQPPDPAAALLALALALHPAQMLGFCH